MEMTIANKERFCLFAAALIAPPEAALVHDLEQNELREWLNVYVEAWGADRQLLAPFLRQPDADDFLSGLQREYMHLFDPNEEDKISLVESTYKRWTADKTCGMIFAASKGLLMGDCAAHMLDLYRELSIEIPQEFRGMPDHLALELEFLALLYQSGSKEQIEEFIADHLDWVPDLEREIKNSTSPRGFYLNSIELINLFLQNETGKGKNRAHG